MGDPLTDERSLEPSTDLWRVRFTQELLALIQLLEIDNDRRNNCGYLLSGHERDIADERVVTLRKALFPKPEKKT